jgi:four helix bundle protein
MSDGPRNPEEHGYEKLRIYKKAHDLALRVHRMSMDLPDHERFEEGGQIRRSSKSVSSLIVEGHSLRRSKGEYVHYLWRAYGSSQETLEHLKYLFETGSLQDRTLFEDLCSEYRDESKMPYHFVVSVEEVHDPEFGRREAPEGPGPEAEEGGRDEPE